MFCQGVASVKTTTYAARETCCALSSRTARERVQGERVRRPVVRPIPGDRPARTSTSPLAVVVCGCLARPQARALYIALRSVSRSQRGARVWATKAISVSRLVDYAVDAVGVCKDF